MEKPMDILDRFPIRKSKKQKQAFRGEVISYLQRQGYSCRVEAGSFGSRNLVVGDSESAEYLVTAHYDTCAMLPFPNMAFPCSLPMSVIWQLVVIQLMLVIPVAAGAGIYALTELLPLAFGIGGLLCMLETVLVLVGPANRHCVNDNTSGVITLLEIASAMPEEARKKVCFVLFDLEEAGLLGSASYRKKHKKESDNQVVLNLDCVGDGNHIVMLPSKKVRKDKKVMEELSRCGGWYGDRRIFVHRKGFFSYASDQKNFPMGVGICALRRKCGTLYLGRIHTFRDTVLEVTNVNLLRAAIVSMIAVRQ